MRARDAKGNCSRTRASGKVFDDALKTFQQKIPESFIPLINEAFSTEYASNVRFGEPRNEYVTEKGKKLSDSVICLGGKKYHAEIQANPDSKMGRRMLEYDFLIALEDAEESNGALYVVLPESCLIYVRHNSKTPDRITTIIKSGICEARREIRVIKVMDYSLDEIENKKLFVFLPYYIINYEKSMGKYYKRSGCIPEAVLQSIRDDYSRIHQMLSEKSKEVERGRICNLIDRVAEHIFAKLKMNDEAKEEVRKAMGGQVLELEVDIAEARGEARGMELGMNSKAEQVFLNMIKRGYDINEAISISEISAERVETLMNQRK